MIFELGPYTLDIDSEKTREYYRSFPEVTYGCDCQGCRNYSKWLSGLKAEPRLSFENWGLPMERISEFSANCLTRDGKLFCDGFGYLCGKILQGPELWIKTDEKHRRLNNEALVDITEDFSVYFEAPALIVTESNFPEPTIRLGFHAYIPFLLDEECKY